MFNFIKKFVQKFAAKRNIYVRVGGRVVAMTTKEWQTHTARLGEPNRVPYRLLP